MPLAALSAGTHRFGCNSLLHQGALYCCGMSKGSSDGAREKLLEAGEHLLLTDPIRGLERLLSRDQLAKQEGTPSRDTAFRAFRSSGETIERIAEWISSTERSGFDQVIDQLSQTYRDQTTVSHSFTELVATLKQLLKFNLQFQFSSRGTPAGWVITAAALTSSQSWQGVRPAEEQRALGQRLLEIRRSFYDDMNARLSEALGLAMSQLGRRPRKGMTKEQIMILMHALSDGLALRLFIDPDAIDADLAADAIFQLAWSFTESGPDIDDRRPEDDAAAELFDRVVQEAITLWQSSGSVGVEQAAEAAGLDRSVTTLWFGNIGDLADSAVRALVATQGLPDFESAVGVENTLDAIGGFLAFLSGAARVNRSLFEVARAVDPERSTSVLDDLGEAIGDYLARHTRSRQPEQTGKRLVEAALTENEALLTGLIGAIGV